MNPQLQALIKKFILEFQTRVKAFVDTVIQVLNGVQESFESFLVNVGMPSLQETITKIIDYIEDPRKTVGIGAHDPWTLRYVSEAYSNGVSFAYNSVTSQQIVQGIASHHIPITGMTPQFQKTVISAFQNAIEQERLQILIRKSLSEVKALSDSVRAKISQVVSQGFLIGKTRKQIAGELRTVAKLSKNRAAKIAATELARARSEGQLDAFQKMGIVNVGVKLGWITREGACKRCIAASKRTYTVEQARGLIPLHPHCYCSWSTVIVKAPEPVNGNRKKRLETFLKDVRSQRKK